MPRIKMCLNIDTIPILKKSLKSKLLPFDFQMQLNNLLNQHTITKNDNLTIIIITDAIELSWFNWLELNGIELILDL